MAIKTVPIVGAFFRPPAKTVLECLALDTPMKVVPEPENRHDPNAMAVRIFYVSIPDASLRRLEKELPSCGWSLESLEDMGDIHVGYIPKHIAKIIKERGFTGAEGIFKTAADGKPMIEFDDPTKLEATPE